MAVAAINASTPALKTLHLAVEILELSIPIWMAATLSGLPVGLQAVAQAVQQAIHGTVTGAMPLALQLLS